MKQKTALRICIDKFQILKEKATSIQDKLYLDAVISVLSAELPTEREQIETQSTDFAVWLVKNNYVSIRGNIWVDTNINKGNKTYNINELFKIFNDNFQE